MAKKKVAAEKEPAKKPAKKSATPKHVEPAGDGDLSLKGALDTIVQKSVERAEKTGEIADAAGEAEAATAEVQAAIDDDTDSQYERERQELRKKLQALEQELEQAQSRLSSVRTMDLAVVDASRRAKAAEQRLAEIDAERKEAKKASDAALKTLLDRVHEMATGQRSLPFPDPDAEATAPEATPVASGAKEPKAKKAKKGEKPAAAADAAFAPAGAEPGAKEDAVEPGEEAPGPAQKVEKGAWDPIRDASLSSVSIETEPGKMESLPPGLVESLREAKFETAGEVWDAIVSKEFKVKGVGPTGLKKLEMILGGWFGGGAQESMAPAPEPPVDAERGEATAQWCSSCDEMRAADAVGPCAKCGEKEYIYKVGYFGQPGCDEDGDFVMGETLKFSCASMKGMSSGLIVAKETGGLYRVGYEVVELETEDSVVSKLPNVKDGKAYDRAEALRRGFFELYQAVLPGLKTEKARSEFLAAGRIRFGVDPQPLPHPAEGL